MVLTSFSAWFPLHFWRVVTIVVVVVVIVVVIVVVVVVVVVVSATPVWTLGY